MMHASSNAQCLAKKTSHLPLLSNRQCKGWPDGVLACCTNSTAHRRCTAVNSLQRVCRNIHPPCVPPLLLSLRIIITIVLVEKKHSQFSSQEYHAFMPVAFICMPC